MKKTIIALFALTGAAYGATLDLHGTTFKTPDTITGFQGNSGYQSSNYLITEYTYGNLGTNPQVGGLHITGDGCFRLNGTWNNLSINYLYIESSDAVIADGLSGGIPANTALGWANTTSAMVTVNNNGWVDINNSFDRINVNSMQNGSIYLNTNGALTLGDGNSLQNGVTVYATITDTANERTLVTGKDLSNWAGNVILQNADGTEYNAGEYTWEATATGLQIIKAVPEPTTATLSLLALAGLAVRRRRK